MTTLMNFLLGTLKPRLNDPANARMWLPGALLGMRDADGAPVLPITAGDQDIGEIGGPGGCFAARQFATDWGIVNDPRQASPDPARPLPVMTLPQVKLDGLQNIAVGDTRSIPQAAGYAFSIDLLLGAYSELVQGVPMSPLTISGRYHLSQSLLIQGAGTVVNVDGAGEFTAHLADCKIVVTGTVAVTGRGGDRTEAVTVEALRLAPVAGGEIGLRLPRLTLDGDPGQTGPLIEAIAHALQAREGREAIATAAQALLSSAANLRSVNRLVSGRARAVLDAIAGPVPAGGLPADGSGQRALTAVDQYLFDRIRLALTVPSSGWFLPLQVASCADPVLEPYARPRVEVPGQVIMGLEYTDIVLSEILLSGASNVTALAAATVLQSGHFVTRLEFGTLAPGAPRPLPRHDEPVTLPVPPPPPLAFSSRFSLVQRGIRRVTVTGTLTATIAGAAATMTVAPAGADVDHLTLTLTGVGTDLSRAGITAAVVLDPRDSGLEQILNLLFARAQVQGEILGALNAALKDQQAAISSQFSQIARHAILAQIGG